MYKIKMICYDDVNHPNVDYGMGLYSTYEEVVEAVKVDAFGEIEESNLPDAYDELPDKEYIVISNPGDCIMMTCVGKRSENEFQPLTKYYVVEADHKEEN